MREYLEPMLGATGALIAQFAVTLVAILILVLIVFWLIRRFTGGRFGTGGGRSRQPRLSVLDALPIDQRRRLVLVRRDNVEHLLLIGGPSDVVVESAIHRPPPAQRRAEAAPQRGAAPARGQAPANEVQRAAAAAMDYRREPAETAPAEPEAVRPHEPPEPAPPAPEPVVVAAAPAEPEPPQPAPRPARGGVSGFLGGGRARPQSAAEPPAPRRVRVADTAIRAAQRPAPGPSPFAREPARPEQDAEPVRPAGRLLVPPAPPLEASPFGSEPFGAPEVAAPARIEPTVERPDEPAPAEMREARGVVPAVEPPTRDDQPVPLPDIFGEEAPILSHGETAAPEAADDQTRARASQVGDLEKEMARLLGEISGSKR